MPVAYCSLAAHIALSLSLPIHTSIYPHTIMDDTSSSPSSLPPTTTSTSAVSSTSGVKIAFQLKGTTSRAASSSSSSGGINRVSDATGSAATHDNDPMGGVEEVVSMSGSRITGYVAVHSRETAAAEARDMDRSITFVCSYAPWYDRSKPRKPTGPVVIPLEGFEATDEYRARIAELQAQAEARRRKTSNAAAIIDEARAAIDRMDAEDDAAASSAAAARHMLLLRAMVMSLSRRLRVRSMLESLSMFAPHRAPQTLRRPSLHHRSIYRYSVVMPSLDWRISLTKRSAFMPTSQYV